MKTTVSVYDFRSAFQSIRPDNFSYEGLSTLFDYLEEYEESCGEEMELDVIAICCDFAEDTVEGIASSYDIDLEGCEDEDEKADKVREYLEDEGCYIGEGGTDTADRTYFVYRQF